MAENVNDCGGKGCKRLWAFVILAARRGFGRFFPGYYYYQARLRDNFVTVKGLA